MATAALRDIGFQVTVIELVCKYIPVETKAYEYKGTYTHNFVNPTKRFSIGYFVNIFTDTALKFQINTVYYLKYLLIC